MNWREGNTSKQYLAYKYNWVGHILKINFIFHDAIEGQMLEVKGVGRIKQ